jgi:hypothetical protein
MYTYLPDCSPIYQDMGVVGLLNSLTSNLGDEIKLLETTYLRRGIFEYLRDKGEEESVNRFITQRSFNV